MKSSYLALALVLAFPWIGETCVEQVAELPDGPALAVDLEGDLAVFGSGRVLIVADLSDPVQPVEVGRVVLTGVVRDIDILDERAYVATGESGLAIVDLSDPSAPFVLGTAAAAFGEVIDVVADGSYAYAVERAYPTQYAKSTHLDVIDVSQPSQPVLVGSVETQYRNPVRLAVSGDVVFLAAYPHLWPAPTGEAIRVYDVSDPEQPVELGLPTSSLWGADGIEVVGDELFVLGEAYLGGALLEVFDLGDPASPVQIGHLELESYGQTDLAVIEGHAVVITVDSLVTVDVSDPEHPAIVGSLDRPGRGAQVAAGGSIAAVAADADGLRIIDISSFEEPTVLGGLETPGSADFINIVGDLAVVSAEWSSSLGVGDAHLVDVSEPTRPGELGTLPVEPRWGRVTVDGPRAYVMTGGFKGREPGLAIIDITDPTVPVEDGFLPTDSVHNGMDVQWPYAYLVSLGVLRVIDVEDPSVPTMVREMEIVNGASSIVVDGDYAYMGKFTNRPGVVHFFQVLDVSDPLAPAELGSLMAGPYWDLHVGDGVVVGGSMTGMAIVDARNPMDPESLYSTRMERGDPYAVAVDGRTAAVTEVLAAYDRGPGFRNVVDVFHLDNPGSPRKVVAIVVPCRAKDIGVIGDFVFVAGGDAGVFVYDVSACGVPTTRRSGDRALP